MPRPNAALARCVGDVDAFAARHWGRAPLLFEDPGARAFADLLSVDDVDHLITSSGLRAPAFRLVKDGAPLEPSRYLRSARIGSRPVNDLADPGRVLAEFDAGATIVLQGLHRYWLPLSAFCRDLELTLAHPVQANAYFTPPTSAGLDVHADAHDVFALQVHGRKQWVVYWDDAEPQPRDLELAPGAALYLPRGVRHAARTVDEPSLHVTVGVRATTWHDVARRALDRLEADDGLAESLPLGFASDPSFPSEVALRLRELARAVEKLDTDEIAQAVADATLVRPPLLAGGLRDLLDVGQVTDDTPVERRAGAVCAVRRHDDRVEVILGDRRLTLPAYACPALERIAGSERLRPADLADHLDEPGRVVLVRRLVREGLLTLAQGRS